MPADGQRVSTEHDPGDAGLDRRTVLKTVGAASAAGVGVGTATADHDQPNDGSVAPWIRGSTRQVMVKDCAAGATVTLYGPDGSQLAQKTADDLGSQVFRDLTPGDGYQVTQTVDGSESPRSEGVEVFGLDYTPPQSFYDNQTLDNTTLDDDGFGYFEVRDGTELALQVQVPKDSDGNNDFDGGPYPVLIMYSGYAPSTNLLLPPELVNSLGYALVGVNKRGTQCSGGKFDLWEQLQWLDGYDMVETIAAQDWADGIGLVGASYSGYSQFYVAATQPPSLDAISPGHPVGDFYRGVGYPGGVLNNKFATGWASSRDSENKPFTDDPGFGDVDERVTTDQTCHRNQLLRLQNKSTVGRLRDTEYATAFYESRSPWNFVEDIEVPTLLAASWQDEQVGSRSTRLMEQFAEDTMVRFVGLNGDHSAYLAALGDLIEFFSLYVKEESLANDDRSYQEALDAYESADPVKIYWELNQDNNPRFSTTYPEWPPGETWELYLRSGGALAADPPEESGRSTYNYVAPTTDEQTISRDSQDRLQWEQRADGTSVSFVSERLDEDHVCVGSGLVKLWLKSTADDTDLQVNLSEIRPDGEEIHVQEGWLRASHRAEDDQQTKPRRPFHTHRPADQQPLPDEFTELRVELFPFAHIFRADSRVRVSVSNPGGNRDLWAFDVLDETATNEIAHSATRPSKVQLPLVPDESTDTMRPDCGTVRNQPCRPVELPTVVEGAPKTTGGDGAYRDVRGDGEFDILDVQALFSNLDNPAVQEHAWAYNFSETDPSEATVLDVQALFTDLDGSSSQ